MEASSKIVLNILSHSQIRIERNFPGFIIVCELYKIMRFVMTSSCMYTTYFIILYHPIPPLIPLLNCFLFQIAWLLLASVLFLDSAFARKCEIICLNPYFPYKMIHLQWIYFTENNMILLFIRDELYYTVYLYCLLFIQPLLDLQADIKLVSMDTVKVNMGVQVNLLHVDFDSFR